MKYIKQISIYLLSVLFLLCNNTAFSQPKTTTALKLGEPAPPFKYSYWIQGKPVDQFKKGQVYVVEFWATWCGYCIQAMPHLSELNNKYNGKVNFIGVDVHETTPWGEDPIAWHKSKLAKFVSEGKGKTMNYNVCRDTKDEYLWNNWVTGQSLFGVGGQGIPFSVMIDKNGNVAWVGFATDYDRFNKALDEIVNDTYDVKQFISWCGTMRNTAAANAKSAVDKREDLAKSPVLEAMNKAYESKDYVLALKEAYGAIAKNPKLTGVTFIPRLNAYKGLVTVNSNQALELVTLERARITAIHDTTNNFLNSLAATFGKQPGLDKKCYDFAVETLKNQPGERVTTYRLLDGLAYAYYYQGNKEMAIKVMQQLAGKAREFGKDPGEYVQAVASFNNK